MTPAPSAVRTREGSRAVGPPWATVMLVAAALVLLLDLLRVFMPSLAFIFGQIGTSPASDFAILGILVFATAALASRSVATNVDLSVLLIGGATVVARLGLVIADGGKAQLLVASLGLVGAIALLGALAASDLSPREAARGLALGFVAHGLLNAVLFTKDSIWYGGFVAWAAAILTVSALVVGYLLTRPSQALPALRTTAPWTLVGPLVAVQGIAAGTPGALRGVLGEGTLASVGLVAALCVGYAMGRRVVSGFLREAVGTVGMGVAAFTAIFLLSPNPGATAAASLLVALLTPMALVIAGEESGDVLASRGRRSAAPGIGMLLYLVIGLGYYVSYELDLGMPREIFPAAAALIVGVLLLRVEARPDADGRLGGEKAGYLALTVLVAVAVSIARSPSVPEGRAAASLGDVRVMTYNVRMGFDLDGRFSVGRLAEVIRREDPDIVVLNEVDRGWALTGGHDVLALLAADLRMDAVFGPAADSIWGNAVLSRLPMSDAEVTELPTDGSAMSRSALSVTVDLGDGQFLAVIGTHLSHTEDESDIRAVQVATVEGLATTLQLRGLPVAILGDLNAEPGSPELAGLAGYVDAVAVARDGQSLGTWPSNAPIDQIDHILASPGFEASDLSVPRSTASDHLAVAVTLRGQFGARAPSTTADAPS